MPERAPDRDAIASVLRDSITLHQQMLTQDLAPVAAAAAAIRSALAGGAKVLAFGNGGSAADAQHLAAELVGRFQRERPALAALALTADTSVLTSIGNDAGFELVFARQIEALGRRGDVALGISTSGRSANVQRALDAARKRGLTTVAVTGGDGGPIGRAADIHVNVPASSTARVQEVHRTLLHAICQLVEQDIGDR
jgi:D-sedoheptulose 7-phosphate isomerase